MVLRTTTPACGLPSVVSATPNPSTEGNWGIRRKRVGKQKIYLDIKLIIC